MYALLLQAIYSADPVIDARILYDFKFKRSLLLV
jgi:hypothetical protein